MAHGITSTGYTFPDATTQTTAAGALTTASVLAATAGASVGAVGTYAILRTSTFTSNSTTNPSLAFGGTRAGSSLVYAGFPQPGTVTNQSLSCATVGGSPAGTWLCIGALNYYVDTYNSPYRYWGQPAAFFLRIS